MSTLTLLNKNPAFKVIKDPRAHENPPTASSLGRVLPLLAVFSSLQLLLGV